LPKHIFPESIAEIKKIGKGKILIEAMSANAANRITKNLRSTFMLSFHTKLHTKFSGVIQDVPVEIDIEAICSNIEAPRYKILIQRLNRRVNQSSDGKFEYIPFKILRIKFVDQILPKEIFIFKTK